MSFPIAYRTQTLGVPKSLKDPHITRVLGTPGPHIPSDMGPPCPHITRDMGTGVPISCRHRLQCGLGLHTVRVNAKWRSVSVQLQCNDLMQ